MATKTKILGLNAFLKATEKQLMKFWSEEQSRLLIEYAKRKVTEIGNRIQEYHSRNHMDRTGNLLNSLCWGVSYDGKLVEGGFYREQGAAGVSFLHEWFSGDEKYLYPVDGHNLAASYIQKYGNNGAKGWRVFFAILAPYWGYWEKGFSMYHNYGGYSTFHQFAVMTQYYDEVKKELKPARTRFRTSVVKYNHEKIKKRWERYAETGR